MGGAWARIIVPEQGENHVEAWDMPKTERDLADLVRNLEKGLSVKGLIERVHSMPAQGIVSAWKFSGNYHGCRMAMICAGLSFDEVTPQAWQKFLGISPRKKTETKVQHKNKLKAKAQQLFPNIKVTLANADALCLAEYLRRISSPQAL